MDAQRSKDELAREKLLQAEERVLDVDEASAPAKVVIEVFAPIRRGRDEHLFMFLLFSFPSIDHAPIPWVTNNPFTRFTGHACDGDQALLLDRVAHHFNAANLAAGGGDASRCSR